MVPIAVRVGEDKDDNKDSQPPAEDEREPRDSNGSIIGSVILNPGMTYKVKGSDTIFYIGRAAEHAMWLKTPTEEASTRTTGSPSTSRQQQREGNRKESPDILERDVADAVSHAMTRESRRYPAHDALNLVSHASSCCSWSVQASPPMSSFQSLGPVRA